MEGIGKMLVMEGRGGKEMKGRKRGKRERERDILGKKRDLEFRK